MESGSGATRTGTTGVRSRVGGDGENTVLSVGVAGGNDGSRRALERRVAAIADFALLPAGQEQAGAADVLLVAADRAAFDQTRRIASRAAAARPPVLVVVDEPFEELLSVLWLGARGIVLSSAPDRELADCAALVARRCTVVPEQVLGGEGAAGRRLFDWAPGHDPREALGRLSPREREVLTLVGSGRTNAEIAERLWLSSNTVRSHVQRIMRKLGLRNRLCLIIFAHELRLMVPAAPQGGIAGGGAGGIGLSARRGSDQGDGGLEEKAGGVDAYGWDGVEVRSRGGGTEEVARSHPVDAADDGL
jgi:DNA-binding NarL/FixJ family response regulator